MTCDDALRRLSDSRLELERHFGVRTIGIFGSVARGDDQADSDIDVLVEFLGDAHVGLFGFVRLQQHLESVLGRTVDLVTPDALRPQFRERILEELVRAT